MSPLAEDGLPPLRDVIARHGLSARKALGQNFLMDLNLTGRIARAAGKLDGAQVLEIGPGPGGLTRALLAEGAQVTAVERDPRCLAALAEVEAAWPGRLTVIEGDALETQPAFDGPYRIVANLPYNIATPLFTGWMSGPWPPQWESLTLMFQKEVAERITAQPGAKAYGRLAVLAQWRADVRLAFTVSPKAFTPAPKVWSAIVTATPLAAPRYPADGAVLQRVAKAAFGQRRKMLRQSLKAVSQDPKALLDAAEVEETQRADATTLAEFCAISRALAGRQG